MIRNRIRKLESCSPAGRCVVCGSGPGHAPTDVIESVIRSPNLNPTPLPESLSPRDRSAVDAIYAAAFERNSEPPDNCPACGRSRMELRAGTLTEGDQRRLEAIGKRSTPRAA